MKWFMARLATAVLSFPALAAAAPGPDGVLVLYSNQRPTPAQVTIEDALRTVIADGYKRPVQIHSEYLDDEWASLETYGARNAEFLHDKYERRNVRVVVVAAIPALEFTTRFRDRIAPGVPVVHLIVARDRVDPATLPSGFVGSFEDNDPTPTLELALRLHPQTNRLVFIRGASERDRLWDRRVRSAVDRLGSTVEVEHLSGLATADVLRRVAALPPGAIVYTPGYFVDGAGAVGTPRQSVSASPPRRRRRCTDLRYLPRCRHRRRPHDAYETRRRRRAPSSCGCWRSRPAQIRRHPSSACRWSIGGKCAAGASTSGSCPRERS
jgi:hypothetical protein